MRVQRRSVDGSRKQKRRCGDWQQWAGCRLQTWRPTRTLRQSGSSRGSSSCLQSLVTRSLGSACRWRAIWPGQYRMLLVRYEQRCEQLLAAASFVEHVQKHTKPISSLFSADCPQIEETETKPQAYTAFPQAIQMPRLLALSTCWAIYNRRLVTSKCHLAAAPGYPKTLSTASAFPFPGWTPAVSRARRRLL